MKSNNTFAAIGCVFVLSACGGGGGGGGGAGATSTAPSTPATTLSAITPVNAASATYNSFGASYLASTWSAAVPGYMTGASIALPDVGIVSPVFDLIRDAYRQDGGNLLTGVSRTYSCSGGGTMVVDATRLDQSTPTNGDTWNFTANNCTVNGNTQTGSMSIKISGVSGDVFHSASGSITLDTVFHDFATTAGVMTTTANGDMRIGVTRTNVSATTFVVSGTSLVETVQQSGATLATRTLTAYSVTSSKGDALLTTSANFSLSGNSKRLGQFAYTVKNLQPFISTNYDMPTSGALIVYGAGSSVTMTVTPDGVRMDYSDNANGTIVNSATRAWSDFLGAY
jgi:hypothetical protein